MTVPFKLSSRLIVLTWYARGQNKSMSGINTRSNVLSDDWKPFVRECEKLTTFHPCVYSIYFNSIHWPTFLTDTFNLHFYTVYQQLPYLITYACIHDCPGLFLTEWTISSRYFWELLYLRRDKLDHVAYKTSKSNVNLSIWKNPR